MAQSHPITWRRHALAVLILTLLWGVFFWRLLTPSISDRVIFAEGDFTVQFFANSSYQAERLRAGEIPLWDAYNYGGQPFAANLQWGMWYPPRWLAVALWGDGWQAEDLQREVALHYWLASLMTYAFFMVTARRFTPALFGAVVFSYGGYLTAYPLLQPAVLYSAVWLPLALTGLHISASANRRIALGGIGLAGVALGLSGLGGHPQTTMFLGYAAVAYLLYTGWERGLRLLALMWRLAAFGALGVGIAAAQLIPAFQFMRLSSRGDGLSFDEIAGGFTLPELLHVALPYLNGEWSPLYVGVVPLLLALVALWRLDATTRLWAGLAAVTFALSMGANAAFYDFFYVFVPGFGMFRSQEHIAFIFSFSLTALAVWGLIRVLEPAPESPPTRRLIAGLVALSAVIAFAAMLNGGDLTERALYVVLIGAAAWYALGALRGRALVVALLALVIVDLFSINTRLDNYVPDTPQNRPAPPAELARMQVDDPREIAWYVDGGGGIESHGVYWRIPDIYGNGPLFLQSMAELRTVPVHRFWELLSVRYIATSDEPPPEADLELLAYGVNSAGIEYRVFEVNDPRPIAHLVYSVVDAQGSAAFARQFIADPNVDLREYAVVLTPLDLPGTRPDVSAVDFRWIRPERAEMTVSTGADALLTVTLPRYPGWVATVDGERVEIVDVYAGLTGVLVPAGDDRRVVLMFQPGIVPVSVALSVLAALLAVGLMGAGWFAGRHD